MILIEGAVPVDLLRCQNTVYTHHVIHTPRELGYMPEGMKTYWRGHGCCAKIDSDCDRWAANIESSPVWDILCIIIEVRTELCTSLITIVSHNHSSNYLPPLVFL